MSSEFGDVIERGTVSSPIPESNKGQVKTPPKKEPNATILEMVEGLNIEGISDKMNPEMKEKVLIPLANLLDKYGVSDSISESTTAQSTMGLMGLIGDVAPVIKGLAEYISGQRNSLREEDKAFLDKIKSAQSDSDFSDLFVSESEPEVAKTSAPTLIGPMGENLAGINISNAEVDWYAVMGVENPTAKVNGMNPQLSEAFFGKDVEAKLPALNISKDKPTIIGLQSIEDMASGSGIAFDEVNNADSKYREVEKVKGDERVEINLDEHELITLEETIGMPETIIPSDKNGDSIFSETSDLLGGMSMDDFNISLESED